MELISVCVWVWLVFAEQDSASHIYVTTCNYFLQKFRKEKIGTICKEYVDLKGGIIELGKGGFGKVYKYEEPDNGRLLAIKVEERVCLQLHYSLHW